MSYFCAVGFDVCVKLMGLLLGCSATHDEDTRFAPAWITFAHSFAFEKEHEQAITAYSTTARLFPG